MTNKPENEIKIKNARTFFKKKVTKFGTGAKIDCPKEYLDKEAVIIISDK